MKKSKGVELPMNTMVVVAIAVIILLSLTAFFLGVFTPTQSSSQAQQEFNNACAAWARLGCPDDVDKYEDVINKVAKAYEKYYNVKLCNEAGWDGCTDENQKKNEILKLRMACGCIGVPQSSGTGGGTGGGQVVGPGGGEGV